SNQFESGSTVVRQFRIPGQIFLDPNGFAGFQAQFEVDVDQLDQQEMPKSVISQQVFVDLGPALPAPGALETLDRILQVRPVFADCWGDVLIAGPHDWLPRCRNSSRFRGLDVGDSADQELPTAGVS